MRTLHSYILGELIKAFLLTLTALTILFTLGGGLWNVIHFEGVSTRDIVSFLPMLLPIAITLAMPIAALFAATIVYGRLAADNELLACRAAGINIHRLFLPTLLLSVFVTAFTLLFGGFIIPNLIHGMESFARKNVRDFVKMHLEQDGFLHRNQERFTITAEQVESVTDAALRKNGFEVADGIHYLGIKNPTYLQVDEAGNLSHFTSAAYALGVFDTRQDPLAVTVFIADGQDYTVGKQALTITQQQFGPMRVRLPSLQKLAFAPYADLLYWHRAPWDAPGLSDKIDRFVETATHFELLTRMRDRLAAGEELRLADQYGEYRIRSSGAEIRKKSLVLTQPRVVARLRDSAGETRYVALAAELNARVVVAGEDGSRRGEPMQLAPTNGGGERQVLLEIRLLDKLDTANQLVEEYAPGATEPRRKRTTSLDVTLAANDALAGGRTLTRADVINPAVTVPGDANLADERTGLQTGARQMVGKVIANLNFRLGITASALVTLIMGAALGVIFRGARALAAFGLSLIPFFSVLILMVLGRQITEDPHARGALIGPYVTWGGLVLVGLADWVILRVGVRR